MHRSALPAAVPPGPVRLRLLDEFRLDVDRDEVMLTAHAQRVLAYLALSRSTGAAHRRTTVAGQLWGECPNRRAHASLRTSIWRIRQADERLVHADRDRVHLGAHVEVDVQLSLEQADRLLDCNRDLDRADATIVGLVADLLPGWDDEW